MSYKSSSYDDVIGQIRVLARVLPWFCAFLAGLTSLATPANILAGPQGSDSQQPQELTPGLTDLDIQDGWLSLFDGESLFGWKPVTDANWRVERGEIRVNQGTRGLLRTTTQFDDFEMLLEFKAGAATNSGVFLRTNPDPRNVLSDCYEVNIAPPSMHAFSTGAIVGRRQTPVVVRPEQWHQFRILADGGKIKVWVDGQRMVDYRDPRPLGRGYIGLQFNAGPVAFRNIALKPLNQEVLFDGKGLERWKTDQLLASQVEVTDEGEMRITGGRGQVESRPSFGDMVFSLQCRTNADGLNSGVFFRCIPGEVMNGYESQIQNQFNAGDRRQPTDCGTGGIFRRQNARRVVANDKEWFTKTVITTGRHISVWVNGYQVTDWTDTRKPDPNPRRGYRQDAGTIALQGHDPTTDILFRAIKAKELAKRR